MRFRRAMILLASAGGNTFQRPKTWKESTDPDYDAKLDRIEYVIEHFPDRVFDFDEFGPLGIRPPRAPAGPSRDGRTANRRPTTASAA